MVFHSKIYFNRALLRERISVEITNFLFVNMYLKLGMAYRIAVASKGKRKIITVFLIYSFLFRDKRLENSVYMFC